MTITNWSLSPDRAVTINDALASDITYAPYCFTTKSRNIPHLQIIMTCKGAQYPEQVLWERCMGGLLVKDVTDLAAIAGPILAHAYQQIRPLMPEDECEIFLFGWSAAQERIMGYAFRFQDGFVCEPLDDGTGIIPAIRKVPKAWLGKPLDWGKVVLHQQAEDRAMPQADRDNIGGSIILQQLVRVPGTNRANIQVDTFGPMPHYREDLALLAGHSELLPASRDQWNRCAKWLEPSFNYDPAGRAFQDIQQGYLAGAYMLLEGQRSCALLERVMAGGNLHLHGYLVGGDLAEVRDTLRPQIEIIARRAGATTVVLTGRRGWARAFRPFGYHLVTRTSAKNWITAKDVRPQAAA